MNDVKNLITLFEFRMENLQMQLAAAKSRNDENWPFSDYDDIYYIEGKISELDLVLTTMKSTLTR